MTTFLFALAGLAAVGVVAFAAGAAAGRSRREALEMLRSLHRDRETGALSPDEFDRRRSALDAALLETTRARVRTWRLALIPGAAVLVVAGLHVWLIPSRPPANVSDIAPPAVLAPTMPASRAPSNAGGDLGTMTERLATRLARQPNDAQGWALLARAYAELGRFPEAESAFQNASRLLPQDAALLADWAAARVHGRGESWDDQSRGLLARALAIDPAQVKALSLAGAEALGRGDHKQAMGYWERMKAAAPPGSPEAKQAEENLAAARGSGPAPADSRPTPAMDRMLRSTR